LYFEVRISAHTHLTTSQPPPHPLPHTHTNLSSPARVQVHMHYTSRYKYTCTTHVKVHYVVQSELWVRLAEVQSHIASLFGYCALVQHTKCIAYIPEEMHSRRLVWSLLCSLRCQSTLLTEAHFCCRQASLSSAVSEANLHCGLRLICCRRVFPPHSLMPICTAD